MLKDLIRGAEDKDLTHGPVRADSDAGEIHQSWPPGLTLVDEVFDLTSERFRVA